MKRRFLILTLALTVTPVLFAQEVLADSLLVDRADSLHRSNIVERADSLHRNCEFEKAAEAYALLIKESKDSLEIQNLESLRLCSENGLAMAGFTYEPKVLAKHTFSLDEFFLYYPMEDQSWRAVPNVLDSLSGGIVRATYVPEDADELYFSRVGDGGVRNLYRTNRKNGLWTRPVLINEALTSSSDDIYPLLSADGSKLYFASSGLYGVGGYDIYVSNWNESRKDWDEPENLGFPYSSPADDFLYMDTPDGRYTIFASNRECSRDSVCVYVLDFDNVPVRKPVNDPARLREIMKLNPTQDLGVLDNGASVSSDIPENEDTRRYMEQMEKVRALKDSVSTFSSILDLKRQAYAASTDDAERAALTEEIVKNEMILPWLNSELEKAIGQLQKIEMDFLFKGVVIDQDKLLAKADRQVVGQSTTYVFTRMNPGPAVEMEFEVPEVHFDYSFKILPEARFAENQSLPSGIVYQIHFITLPAMATTRQLKGLSPVYETVQANGYHAYRVGLFSRYTDALEHLNAVKSLGFKSASVVSFKDGKSCSLQEAKAGESSRQFWQVNINTGSESIPTNIIALVRDYDGKDVAKVYKDGLVLFVVSPFERKDDAEELEALIREAGINAVSVALVE